MVLETLKDITHVNGHEIKRVEWEQPVDNHIEINDKGNAITFKIQNGLIKDNGVNGCQVDTIIWTAYEILCGLNQKVECIENNMALKYLRDALHELDKRKTRIAVEK